MNSLSRVAQIKLIVVLATPSLLAGCTSQKTITTLGSNYTKANQSAVDAVSAEAKEGKRIRRLAAVIAYINNPNLTIAENINATQLPGSFANFVCTGADDFETISAGLQYTTQYARTINVITTAPEDSISGYVNALSRLRAKNKPLALPDIKKQQFEACRVEVSKDIPPVGITAVTARKEAILVGAIASIEAVQALITSLDKLVKAGLKVATEAEQKAALKAFIHDNEKDYTAVLNEDLKTDEVLDAFGRRRQTAVAAPYYAFQEMMKLSTTTDRREIMRRAVQIHTDLEEYDAIRIQQPPASVTAQFKEMNQQLQDYANGKQSIGDTVQFLSELASELTDGKNAYDDVAKKLGGLRDATKSLN